MRVVLESVNDELATLIPDDGSGAIVIGKRELPEYVHVGDVLEVVFRLEGSVQSIESIERIVGETEKRKARIKSKREKLKNRKN
ncbi:DUF3006 family protein [Marinilactibacillus sp. Marseille-P9653]|uniref:DUF3006 family protein n=1 Tax=Marinilactibacillus sp. Marseille-P9653 TaxID=2866583 RepID=UPI001CE4774E|nr:DUF3006 family protein [Marinilactibacillus sp. Marseille-P9653]